MNQTFQKIVRLIDSGLVKISVHGYDKLTKEGLYALHILPNVKHGIVIDDYTTFPKGPCVLVLQADGEGRPVHTLWGIPKGHEQPAVLITVYRPNPDLWEPGLARRVR